MTRAAWAVDSLLLRHRLSILVAFAVLTALLATAAFHLQIDAGFSKQLPEDHPYIRTLREYRDTFGGADRLLIAVRARDGDIFDARTLAALERVTDAVFFLPGVDRSSVRSIFTSNVRYVDIVEGGFAGGNVVPADFAPTPEAIAEVRRNVVEAGLLGRLVADDLSAALVRADLLEHDPATGAPLDYIHVARRLEEQIREPFVDETIDVHIIGYAKMVGDIAEGARGVLAYFALAALVTAGLVRVALGAWTLALLPLACSLIAVVWTLGLLHLLGFGLDPLSILVPFLVLAIGTSHGVQLASATLAEITPETRRAEAVRGAFRRLLVPGVVALITDAIGFLTVLLIDIPIVREMALSASIGVSVLLATNFVLLPLALSFVRFDDGLRPGVRAGVAPWLERMLAGITRPRRAGAVLLASLAVFALGLLGAQEVRVGDVKPGVSALRPESRYNRDAVFIAAHFATGVDVLQVMVETVPDGCVAHDVMTQIDHFDWHMANVPGVRATRSLPQVAKRINAGWNEGDPRWRVLPRDRRLLAQAVAPVETSTGLLDADCSVMPVFIFTEDHRAATIDRVVAAAEAYKEANDDPRHSFRLAGGNLAVMAATNEVVAAAQAPILLGVYAAVAALCLATFRSARAAICICLPLATVSVLVYALMALLRIGLTPATLPVAAFGVGIGVDYGIYVFARLDAERRRGLTLPAAYARALRTGGRAVLLTGLTLAVGVGTWVFSDLAFQADMGLLLAFMLLANMAGALVLLPALAAVLFPPDARSRPWGVSSRAGAD